MFTKEIELLSNRIIYGLKSHKISISITGGGTEIFGHLLSKGGFSRFLLNGNIPYSKESLCKLLNSNKEHKCNEKTSRLMAIASLKEAMSIEKDCSFCVGVGVTASLKVNNERVGRKNHFYISIATPRYMLVRSYEIKDEMSREDQERLVCLETLKIISLLLNHITDDSPHHSIMNQKYENIVNASKSFFIDDNKECLYYSNSCNISPCEIRKPVIYPGSFNPLHKGHEEIIDWAFNHFNKSVHLEISVLNPDKDDLDFIDIKERKNQIRLSKNEKIAGIYFTKFPMFVEKSTHYLEPIFLIGSDTYNRIVDCKYYKNEEHMKNSFDIMRLYGSSLYVFPRFGHDVKPIPEELIKNTFIVEEFNGTIISSTEIRNEISNSW